MIRVYERLIYGLQFLVNLRDKSRFLTVREVMRQCRFHGNQVLFYVMCRIHRQYFLNSMYSIKNRFQNYMLRKYALKRTKRFR